MKDRMETILIGLIVAVFSLVIIVVLSQFTGVANMFIAWATLMLAFAAFMTIRHSNERERRDRKDSILNEIRDWIFSIKDITLEPITEENIAFRHPNIELKYGLSMSRVELLEMETNKILKDKDLNEKVSKVAKLLAAVMLLDKARYESGNIDENVVEAFPGYESFIKEIRMAIETEANKPDKSKEFVAYDMWGKYIKELNNAEAEVLDRIVSLKSELLKA